MIRSILIYLYFFCIAAQSFAQDTLIFEKNWPYRAHVTDDQPHEVYFRKADVTDSLTYVIDKRYISEIRYQDPGKGRQAVEPRPFALDKPLDIWVTPSDSIGVFKGTLHSLNDTTLFLRKKKKLLEGSKGLTAEVIYVFPFEKIHKVEVRRRNKIQQYATLGAIGGFALGTITGLIIFNDDPVCDPLGLDGGPPCDESLSSPRTKFDKSILLGLGTAGGGFLAGGIAGSVRITIPIGSRRDIFGMAIPRFKRLSRTR